MELFDGRFETGSKIGEGSFGTVYAGIDKKKRNRKVALKIEEINDYSVGLRNEYKAYRILENGPGIPKCYWLGHHYHDKNILAMELLGKSLQQHLKDRKDNKFSLKTILMLIDQMINIIQFIHEKGLIHCDIKPHNFVMGLGTKRTEVFLIDYGLAKEYIDPYTKKHIKDNCNTDGIVGTVCYASINSLLGLKLSRRDDLESLAYMFLYFLQGNLPWHHMDQNDKKMKIHNSENLHRRICDKKISTSTQELCKDSPIEFGILLNYSKNLKFTETPNYAYIRKLFHNLFHMHGYKHDLQFDWMDVSINKSSTSYESSSDDETSSYNSTNCTESYSTCGRDRLSIVV